MTTRRRAKERVEIISHAAFAADLRKRNKWQKKKSLRNTHWVKAGRISTEQKYDTLKKAILSALRKNDLTHTELFSRLNKSLKGKFSGNISWYGETVKLDLEARKIIERTLQSLKNIG